MRKSGEAVHVAIDYLAFLLGGSPAHRELFIPYVA